MKKMHEGRKHIPKQRSVFFKDKRKKRDKEYRKRIRKEELE